SVERNPASAGFFFGLVEGESAFCRAEPMLGCSPAMTLWPILRRLQPPKFAPFDATGLSIVEQ
ncbi:MAG: hypothetical protein RR831_20805, partial [Stenotrophomonas sp.]